MAATREIEIRFVGKFEVDDRTRAALVALGWTPPADDFDPRRHVPKAEPGMDLPLIPDDAVLATPRPS